VQVAITVDDLRALLAVPAARKPSKRSSSPNSSASSSSSSSSSSHSSISTSKNVESETFRLVESLFTKKGVLKKSIADARKGWTLKHISSSQSSGLGEALTELQTFLNSKSTGTKTVVFERRTVQSKT